MKISQLITAVSLLMGVFSPVFAKKGGESGGGGNQSISRTNDREYIRRYLNSNKNTLNRVFNLFEYAHWQVQATKISTMQNNVDFKTEVLNKQRANSYFKISYNLDVINAKLFESNHNIYDYVQSYSANILESGPCYDNKRQPVDASVVNTPAHTICFSLERLAKNKLLKNGFVSLTALVAHEYSHLVGTNEAEARRLQAAVDTLLKPGAEFIAFDMKRQIELANNSISTIKYLLSYNASQFDICHNLEKLTKFIDNYHAAQNNADALGVKIYSIKEMQPVNIIIMKMLNIFKFCSGSFSEDRMDGIDEMYLIEYAKKHSGTATPIDTNGIIKIIRYNDRTNIEFELVGISQQLSELELIESKRKP
ncbi:MAG: hypothetical protein H7061_04805 [Bdellovibrionaceae bacterium]|nr:hypothetical protein [Bdellovibrio sp.]